MEGALCSPPGCAGGLPNQAVVSQQQFPLGSPRKQINKKLDDFVSEFRLVITKASPAARQSLWEHHSFSSSLIEASQQELLNQPEEVSCHPLQSSSDSQDLILLCQHP